MQKVMFVNSSGSQAIAYLGKDAIQLKDNEKHEADVSNGDVFGWIPIVAGYATINEFKDGILMCTYKATNQQT